MDGTVFQFPAGIADRVHTLNLARGEILLARDMILNSIFIVRRGTVMIYHIDENGDENCIVMVSEGEFIGEMEALVPAERIVYHAKAYTDCELISLSVDAFRWWIDTDVRALRRLTEGLARKLYAASMRSTQNTSYDARRRLILALEYLGGGRINRTRQELAETCSVSVRTVNRCVRRLADEGLISVERGKILILGAQLEALRKALAEPGE
jgi:CRP/FNR family cyclic AMP-dependent transcriptional regulator